MILNEGQVKLIAPNVNLKGPGKKEGVFYNRAMVFNRDTSIFLLYNLNLKDALDGLGATGVRGIRFVKELNLDTTINDIDPRAVDIIKKNVELNDVDAEVTNVNVNSLMASRRFGYVDIDPFGTPVKFIDMAILSGDVLGITATDTATLGGRNRRITRRYLADVKSSAPFVHEYGIRVLLGYIGRMAARFDRGMVPIVSLWHGHFYRVYVKIIRSIRRAKETMNNIGMYNGNGPIWLGDLHDFEMLRDAKIPPWLPTKSLLEKYIKLWINERGMFFYHIPSLSSKLKISTPSLENVMNSLEELGFYAARTQFSLEGIRTDAPENILLEILKNK